MNTKSMHNWPWRLAIFFWGTAVGFGVPILSVEAADQVRTKDRTLTGSVKQATIDGIVFEDRVGRTVIPVGDVLYVRFEGEPPALTKARDQIRDGKFASAKKLLDDVAEPKSLPPGVGNEVLYARAVCAGGLALAGSSPFEDAADRLKTFLDEHVDYYTSPQAAEMLAEIAGAASANTVAPQQLTQAFNRLTKSNDPSVRASAWVSAGRMFLAAKDVSHASQAFDRVLAEQGDSPALRRSRALATLGRAECFMESGSDQEKEQSLQLVEDVVLALPAEDVQTHARAYFTMGKVLEHMGRPKDAALAYLHVDLIYSREPSLHARSLRRLIRIWKLLGREDRAQETSKMLGDTFAGTHWVGDS